MRLLTQCLRGGVGRGDRRFQSRHVVGRSVCEMREVYIAAVGLTKVDLTGSIFGNVFDLFQSAYKRALAESDVREFDAVQVGIMDAEEFENRANIAAKVADRLGLVGVPA